MRAAVDGLADPLSDPLPGQRPPAAPEQQEWYDPQGYPQDWSVGQTASSPAEPVRRAYEDPAHGYAEPGQPSSYAVPQPQPQQPYEPQRAYEPQRPYGEEQRPSYGGAPQTSYDGTYAQPPLVDDETVGLRIADVVESIPGNPTPAAGPAGRAVPPTGAAGSAGVPGGGRAARRKASRRHGRHGGAGGAQEGQEEAQESRAASGAPLSRMEARRAARARKPGAAVMASRAIGEVFITTGVLMLLFVTYQLWWTNVRAHAQAGNEASSLQDDWAKGKGNPGVFEPGQGFALLHIPKLDVVVPIAEGTDKKRVLDRGMVGHYAEEGVKTAMPDAKTGNFGLAGHRNTHGEPFRYINRLKPGDPIVVETQDKYFVYKMASILPVTSPSNTAVLDAIPKGAGFTKAGRYITLTTCTPEFTSKYRMIVWGTMVEERSRDKGKPDALVD
ncbi:class E sortase [Streptomyces phaeochromogenes]|uniref:class E sortase n=1 Tax=Streptomyces phaeochromogenes TaxID=1923 RepID=UPI0036A0DCE6